MNEEVKRLIIAFLEEYVCIFTEHLHVALYETTFSAYSVFLEEFILQNYVALLGTIIVYTL